MKRRTFFPAAAGTGVLAAGIPFSCKLAAKSANTVRITDIEGMSLDALHKELHTELFDIFLPIFDEGRLKDTRGREVSFRNCIIIMTSNVGAAHVSRTETQESRKRIMDEMRRHFRPEFINRVDDIVPFYPLLLEDIRSILSLCIRELADRLKEKRIGVHVFQEAYEHLTQQGYSTDFGARELRRTVDRLVITPVSDMILKEQFRSGDTIEVLMENEKLVFQKGPRREEN